MKSIPLRFRERQAVLSQQFGFLIKKQVPEEDLDTGYNQDQIETLRETGMSWKRIALTLGISDSTLYRRRR